MQRLLAFGRWDVYRSSDDSNSEKQEKEKPWFEVKRCHEIMTGKLTCEISMVECQKYCIEKIGAKTAFRIVNTDHGDIVAHVMVLFFFFLFVCLFRFYVPIG